MREAVNLSEGEWTPDAIAHALPTPDMRMEFWRQLNLTAFGELEALGARWLKVIEDLQTGVERAREVNAYQREHGGALPPEYSDVTELITERRVA
ncbi:hypothetical protein AB0958_19420 [Streptomyces sp. NPDC006655]|uniref:hypothetical protein n=1 Tax=Streptomyces sp. NPDC006655 TaxID=3156898 RepID=UPI0034545568